MYVRTCAPILHFSVTAERFVIIFGAVTHALTMHFAQVIGGECLQEHKRTCTPTYPHVFAPARPSPTRRITGAIEARKLIISIFGKKGYRKIAFVV